MALPRGVPILITAAVVAAGVIAIPLLGAPDRPLTLDNTWGTPAVIDVGSYGDPLATFRAATAATGDNVTLGSVRLDPDDLETAVKAPGNPVNGAVPTWFPVLSGALPVRADFDAMVSNGDPLYAAGVYSATQQSLLATSRSDESIGDDLEDLLEETWPEVSTDRSDDGDYVVRASGEVEDLQRKSELTIRLHATPSLPGLMAVTTEVVYEAKGELRPWPGPGDDAVAKLAALATAGEWSLQEWDLESSFEQVVERRSVGVTWTNSETDIAKLAESVVTRLGTPVRTAVDNEGKYTILEYDNGTVRIDAGSSGSAIEWNP